MYLEPAGVGRRSIRRVPGERRRFKVFGRREHDTFFSKVGAARPHRERPPVSSSEPHRCEVVRPELIGQGAAAESFMLCAVSRSGCLTSRCSGPAALGCQSHLCYTSIVAFNPRHAARIPPHTRPAGVVPLISLPRRAAELRGVRPHFREQL